MQYNLCAVRVLPSVRLLCVRLLMARGKEKGPEESNKSVEVSCGSSDVSEHRSIAQQKGDIYKAAEGDEHVRLTPPVKILLVLATLALLILIWYVYYSIHLTHTHDANLEEKILSGKSIESLKALKQQSIQTLSTIFILVIVFVILVSLIGFGYLIFYNQTSFQRERRMYLVVKKASEVVDIQEAKLSSKLKAELGTISRLENNIKECEKEIETHRQADEINEEEIRRLEEEKAEKEEELNEAGQKLEEVQKDLEEARELQKNLKDDVEKEAQSKRELEQELVMEKARTTKLQADYTSEENRLKTALSKEQSETSGLRRRVNDLETLRGTISRLKAEKQALEEEARKKRGLFSWFGT